MNDEHRGRLDYLLRHIENVRGSCELLGRRLLERKFT